MPFTMQRTRTHKWNARDPGQVPTSPNPYSISAVDRLTQARGVIMFLKRLLTGSLDQVGDGANGAGYWTVTDSSDGTTAGAADKWLTDETKLVWAAAGSPHSWIVLKMAGREVYTILDLNRANPCYLDIVFTSQAPTGGTTSARPTAPGREHLYDRANNAIQGTQIIRDPGAQPAAAYAGLRVHAARDDKGGFHLLTNYAGDNYFQSAIIVNEFSPFNDGLAGLPLDAFPFLFHVYYGSQWSDMGAVFAIEADSDGPNWQEAITRAFWLDGTLRNINNGYGRGFGAFPLAPRGTWMPNDIPLGGDSANALLPGIPITVGHRTTTAGTTLAFRGTLIDLWWAPSGTSIVSGITIPTADPPDVVIANQLFLPCRVAPLM